MIAISILLGLTAILVFALAFTVLGVAFNEPEELERKVCYIVAAFILSLGVVYSMALIATLTGQ